MSKLEPVTVAQILEVVRLTKSYYQVGHSIDRAHQEAIGNVHMKYGVAYQTIGDHRRRLGFETVEQFRTLLEKSFIGNDPGELISLLKSYTDKQQHDMIEKVLRDKAAVVTQAELSPIKSKTEEVISFRLDQDSARKLKAMASLKGLSVAEWVAEIVTKNTEEQLKEWAKKYV